MSAQKGQHTPGPIFRTNEDRGYVAEAREAERGDALIRILRDTEVVREFRWPAYKVWNIAAHFSDIVDSEIAGNTEGHRVAGSDGLGGNAFQDGRAAIRLAEGEQ